MEGRQLRPQKRPVMLTAAGQPPRKKFCGAEIGCEETNAHDGGHDPGQSGGGGGRGHGQGHGSIESQESLEFYHATSLSSICQWMKAWLSQRQVAI